MPICITCSTPVKNLYTTYSKADDRSLGKGVRLTQCPNCKRFADKYVEHDYVVLFIDLVLIKPQVYRHLLFNRLGRSDDKLDPSIVRLGILLVLFDVYITWARIEKTTTPFSNGSNDSAPLTLSSSPPPSSNWALYDASITTQYLFFLTLITLATAAQHGCIRLLTRSFLARPAQDESEFYEDNYGYTRHRHQQSSDATSPVSPSKNSTSILNSSSSKPGKRSGHTASNSTSSIPSPPNTTAYNSNSNHLVSPSAYKVGPGHASPSAISTALLVSSCMKLFPILLVIWPTNSSISTSSTIALPSFSSRASSYVSWAVLLNNIEALLILLDCGYVVATGLAIAGLMARSLVEAWVLGMVGLGRDDGGPVSVLFGLWALLGRLGA